MEKLPYTAVHYGAHDPREKRGGVETFARNLGLVFAGVEFMTPADRDFDRAAREGWVVVCDNHFASDWPAGYPVIGFQHGVSAVKAEITGARRDRIAAARQAEAAKRPATVWVACAEWIARTFGELHGNRAAHVIYHPIDVARFDGERRDVDPRLVLHDARSPHKGEKLIAPLQRAFPEWRFEGLDCAPAEVPDRMRRAAAFLHLSKYEGNSIVCNEAMAMDLPCLVTRVGLFNDAERPRDVFLIEVDEAYGECDRLTGRVGEFLGTLGERSYNPRAWTLSHATREISRDRWAAVMRDYDALRPAS